jgi:hypothetical protein
VERDEARLLEFEDRFRYLGLVSFCRRRHLRPTPAVALATVLVVSFEAVLVLPSTTWSTLVDVAVTVAGLLAGLGAIVALQRLERRVERSWGRFLAEAGFLFVPPGIIAVVDSVSVGAEIFALHALLLSFYLLEERSGASHVVRWAIRFAAMNLRGSWRSLWRAVPLLTVVLLAMFLAGETWQLSARLGWANTTAFMVLVCVVGASTGASSRPGTEQLRRSERANITALTAVATSVVAVGAAVVFAAFLVAVGALLTDAELLEMWVGAPVAHVELNAWVQLTLSVPLVQVAAVMGPVAALVFSATLGSDETFRKIAADALDAEIEEAVSQRACYLEMLDADSSAQLGSC